MSGYAHLLDDYNKTKKRLDLAEEQIARVTAERDAISTEAVRLVREAHARAQAAEKQVAALRAALESIIALSERHVTAHSIASKALAEPNLGADWVPRIT